MKTHLLILGLAVTTPIMAAYCQETAAAGDRVHTDTSAIAMSMDAKNMAIMTVLQKLTKCNARKAFYQPSDANADADGCVGALGGPSAGVFTVCSGGDGSSPGCSPGTAAPLACEYRGAFMFGDKISFGKSGWISQMYYCMGVGQCYWTGGYKCDRVIMAKTN